MKKFTARKSIIGNIEPTPEGKFSKISLPPVKKLIANKTGAMLKISARTINDLSLLFLKKKTIIMSPIKLEIVRKLPKNEYAPMSEEKDDKMFI